MYFYSENLYNLKLYFMEKSGKRQRFEKVAGSRVQRVLDTLQLLKNCSNRNNYEYSESDVDQMISEISKALKELRSTYENEIHKAKKHGFSFNSKL